LSTAAALNGVDVSLPVTFVASRGRRDTVTSVDDDVVVVVIGVVDG
jgi:hypothetical protein